MKKKIKNLPVIIPKQKPKRFPPAMINIKAEFIFDPEKIKQIMVEYGLAGKPKELPEPPKEQK